MTAVRLPPRFVGTCALGASMVVLAGCKSKTIQFSANDQAIAVIVYWDVDGDAGIDGGLAESTSTALQSAVWQSSFFDPRADADVSAKASALVSLGADHVLVQVYDSPWIVDSPDAGHWDFSELDGVVQPLLKLGQDPVIQIYKPQWLTVEPSAVGVFADYCANLVRYYNSAGGISLSDGGTIKSNGPPVQSWAIWSDPNTADFDPGQDMDGGATYASFYNAAASAMQSVDRSVRFAGPEFNDCNDDQSTGQNSSITCLPKYFIPQFLTAAADGGIDGGMAPLDVLSLHMFSADLAVPRDAGLTTESDFVAFGTVARFAEDVTLVRMWLDDAGRAGTPVWVTESQVNSDVPTANAGTSQQARDKLGEERPFQADVRGTDAFISAWRPYLFSQLGKSGNQALFQWQFTAGRCPYADAGCSLLDASDTDRQNAEVDYVTGKKYLSYWVDRELALKFPAGSQILATKITLPDPDYSDVEVLATKRTEGGLDTVVVMVVNHAVQTPATDYNGPGKPRNVIVDVTRLFNEAGGDPGRWSASIVTVDAATGTGGPTEAPISTTTLQDVFAIPVTLNGYGVAFITLTRPAGG